MPDDPRTVGYAFKSIRFIRGAPNGPERHEIRDRGWTLVRVRKNARRAALVTPWPWAPVMMRAGSRMFQDPAGRFDRWRERYEGAREVHDRCEYYRSRTAAAGSRLRTAHAIERPAIPPPTMTIRVMPSLSLGTPAPVSRASRQTSGGVRATAGSARPCSRRM